jgi:hypothetical protein
MTTMVTCECGAVYERSEMKLAMRDSDKQNCSFCGRTLESWNSSRIPVFRLVSRPQEQDG